MTRNGLISNFPSGLLSFYNTGLSDGTFFFSFCSTIFCSFFQLVFCYSLFLQKKNHQFLKGLYKEHFLGSWGKRITRRRKKKTWSRTSFHKRKHKKKNEKNKRRKDKRPGSRWRRKTWRDTKRDMFISKDEKQCYIMFFLLRQKHQSKIFLNINIWVKDQECLYPRKTQCPSRLILLVTFSILGNNGISKSISIKIGQESSFVLLYLLNFHVFVLWRKKSCYR